LAFTYVVAAYIILPRTVRIGLKILQRKHVPRYTVPAMDCPATRPCLRAPLNSFMRPLQSPAGRRPTGSGNKVRGG